MIEEPYLSAIDRALGNVEVGPLDSRNRFSGRDRANAAFFKDEPYFAVLIFR
jgi:hypothetical protein